MSLQEILNIIAPEKKYAFLSNSFSFNHREDTAEALAEELEKKIRQEPYSDSRIYQNQEYNRVIIYLISKAEVKGDSEKVLQLQLRLINTNGLSQELRLIKSNSELTQRVIAQYCTKENAHHWNFVVSLMEDLGKKEEAKKYALEVAAGLDQQRKKSLSHGGRLLSHGVDKIYLHFKMYQEAAEVLLDNQEFSGALSLSKKYFSPEKFTSFAQRVYKEAGKKENRKNTYDNNFSIRIDAAEATGKKYLIHRTKKAYVHWLAKNKPDEYHLELFREFGTKEQLREMHEKKLRTEANFPYELAISAAEAYQDFPEEKYALSVINSYERTLNFSAALKFARKALPSRVPLLEEIMQDYWTSSS